LAQFQMTDDLQIAAAAKNGLNTYLDHAVNGRSIRSLAKKQGVHPSTVLRRVRKVELQRDDPLIDEAIDKISAVTNRYFQKSGAPLVTVKENDTSSHVKTNKMIRFLKSLNHKGAFLAVAADLEDAAIFQTLDDGGIRQSLVLGRSDAMVLALNEWVEQTQKGRMSRYQLTSIGRKALKRMIAEAQAQNGFGEAPTAFGHQHIEWGMRIVDGDNFGDPVTHKVNLADSPVALLSRRKGKDGKAFLEPDLVTAAERLLEDFELSQMGPSITQNWDSFLTGPTTQSATEGGLRAGPAAALKRFHQAMRALGPGLSDIALNCCCLQIGLEVAEKRLGWSARSGKVVHRIALQRLQQHYNEAYGTNGPLIG